MSDKLKAIVLIFVAWVVASVVGFIISKEAGIIICGLGGFFMIIPMLLVWGGGD
jgi:hypothetical protein